MKRLFLVYTMFVFALFSAFSQNPVYLNSVCKPEDSRGYKTVSSYIDGTVTVGGVLYKNGFTLSTFYGPTVFGRAEFSLKGKYKTLNFILGTNPNGNSRSKDKGIFVIRADGKKILDKLVADNSVPERISLDVSGVDKLRFEIVEDGTTVAVLEPTLWTAAQTPRETGKITLATAKPTMLVRDLRPYLQDNYHHCVSDNEKYKDLRSISINSKTYQSGLEFNAEMQLIGNASSYTYFNLGGMYKTLKFIVGPKDSDGGTLSTGWVAILADGKIIREIEVGEGDLAKEITVDITGCKSLAFNSAVANGSLFMGAVNIMVYPDKVEALNVNDDKVVETSDRLKNLPDVCKLISNIPPYAVGGGMSRENMVYEGKSDYITFSMGGIKYNEGIILRASTNVLNDNTRAHALFDLGGQFDYVSFTMGWISKSVYLKNDTLKIHADDKLVFAEPLIATSAPKSFVVPIHKCKRLSFEINGNVTMDQPAFGVADIVVYRGEPVDNDLFVHQKPDFPEEVDLLDLGLPYVHYISTYEDRSKAIRDGSSARAYFDVNGKRITKGFLLQTSVHFSTEAGVGSPGTGIMSGALGGSFMVGAVGGVAITAVAPFGALIALAAGGSAHESSCAAFNTWGEYDFVTFTVESRVYDDGDSYRFKSPEDTLLIGLDGRVTEVIPIYEGMKPTSYTIPIHKARQLMFWMPCLGWGSQQYVFYDLKLSKGDKVSKEIPSVSSMDGQAMVVAPVEPYALPLRMVDKKGIDFSTPKRCGVDNIDNYFGECAKAFNSFDKLLETLQNENYKTIACYLSDSQGEIYRGISLVNSTGENYGFSALVSYNNKIIQEIENVKIVFTNLTLSNANANVSLIDLGFPRGVEYGKYIKNAAKTTKAYRKLLDEIVKEKQAEIEIVKELLSNRLTVDGRASDETVVFVK